MASNMNTTVNSDLSFKFETNCVEAKRHKTYNKILKKNDGTGIKYTTASTLRRDPFVDDKDFIVLVNSRLAGNVNDIKKWLESESDNMSDSFKSLVLEDLQCPIDCGNWVPSKIDDQGRPVDTSNSVDIKYYQKIRLSGDKFTYDDLNTVPSCNVLIAEFDYHKEKKEKDKESKIGLKELNFDDILILFDLLKDSKTVTVDNKVLHTKERSSVKKEKVKDTFLDKVKRLNGEGKYVDITHAKLGGKNVSYVSDIKSHSVKLKYNGLPDNIIFTPKRENSLSSPTLGKKNIGAINGLTILLEDLKVRDPRKVATDLVAKVSRQVEETRFEKEAEKHKDDVLEL